MTKKKHKILIVEDDPALLDLYSLRFSQAGYEVLKATDGDEGSSLAQLEIPDVILLDILMPTTDGYEMLRMLKENPKTKNIPSIIFSNLSQRDEVEKGLNLGAKDYIVKTMVTPSELVSRVEQVLG
jgi:DNA-binding response OmpR family regulator